MQWLGCPTDGDEIFLDPCWFQTVLLWTCVFGLSGWGNGTIEGLENPIVSDYFGLSIEKTSYVVSLSLFVVACGSITT